MAWILTEIVQQCLGFQSIEISILLLKYCLSALVQHSTTQKM